MTPEEMRVAICELLHPKTVEWHDGVAYWKGSWSAVGEGNETFAVFDPTNSLDAMHAAEKVLSEHQRRKYSEILADLNHYPMNSMGWACASATAEQRAEAFARTLWPERFGEGK